MLRIVHIAIALVALTPAAAPAQVIPASSTSPAVDARGAFAMEGSRDEVRQAPPPAPGTPRPTPPPGDPQVGPPTRPPQPQPTPGTPPPPSPPRKLRGRDVNVQVEITLGDQLANAAPDKRVVSMLIADAALGRIRSTGGGGIVVPNVEPGAVLNIDAQPEILDGDRIAINLTIEYRPAMADGGKKLAQLHEMLTVILQNGKPQLISQAADPLSDRKMTVEVRASIVK
jgi:hypothetical protein